jgi:hypothetical protein
MVIDLINDPRYTFSDKAPPSSLRPEGAVAQRNGHAAGAQTPLEVNAVVNVDRGLAVEERARVAELALLSGVQPATPSVCADATLALALIESAAVAIYESDGPGCGAAFILELPRGLRVAANA